MDLIEILEQEWSVVRAAPMVSILLVAIGSIAAWVIWNSVMQVKINGLKNQLYARDARKVLVEERLSAVVRHEDMLGTQVAALREQFKIVEDQVIRQGLVPALIAATGSTASTITNVALTAEALTDSLNVLRLGFKGDDGSPFNPTKPPRTDRIGAPSNALIQRNEISLR